MKVNLSKLSMWRVFRTLYSIDSVYFIKVSFLFFIENILEGFGLSLIVPVFYRLLGASSGDTHFAWIDSALLSLHIDPTIEVLLAIMVLIFTLRAIIMYGSKKNISNSSANVLEKLQTKLLRNYLQNDLSFFNKMKTGELVNSVVTEANRASLSFLYLSQWISLLFSVLLYASLALYVSGFLTMTAFIIGFIFFFPLKKITSECERVGGITTALNSGLQVDLSESFSMIKFIKASNHENFLSERIRHKISKYKENWAQTYYLSGAIQIFSNPIGVLILGTILYLGFKMKIASPDLIVFLISFQRLLPSYTSMQAMKNNLLISYPGFTRVMELLEMTTAHSEREQGEEFKSFESLQMQDVVFSYNQDKKIINNLNLNITKGQVTALVGLSGQGKTTLVDLIIGFYTAQAGEFKVNGKSFSDISLRSWRSKISYVTQDTYLFHDSIRENIFFGRAPIANDKLSDLIKLCHAEFIYGLEKGLDTIVGDRGSKLSGGQRQRIALVRALARNPDILILDEATSSLDSESEMMIKNTLDELKNQRQLTIILIAHRLETVKIADQILVINQGQVAEKGRWEDLFNNPDSFFYRKLILRN